LTRILALDSSTPTARVALVGDEARPLAEAETTVDRHSAHVLRLCDQVLAAAGLRAAELTAVACGAGPGSFTGLRVGLSVAKGLALATGAPLLLVSSLEALALDIAEALGGGGDRITPVPCIDAGKGEVYATVTPGAGEPWRLTPAELAARLAEVAHAVVAGNGADRYAAVLDAALPAGARRAAVAGPSARAIARLAWPRHARGEADDLEAAVPAYGRLPDITMPKPRGA
jgi:tRNA threonylcarbamoyladenosine biosynthesis protein TsaB